MESRFEPQQPKLCGIRLKVTTISKTPMWSCHWVCEMRPDLSLNKYRRGPKRSTIIPTENLDQVSTLRAETSIAWKVERWKSKLLRYATLMHGIMGDREGMTRYVLRKDGRWWRTVRFYGVGCNADEENSQRFRVKALQKIESLSSLITASQTSKAWSSS